MDLQPKKGMAGRKDHGRIGLSAAEQKVENATRPAWRKEGAHKKPREETGFWMGSYSSSEEKRSQRENLERKNYNTKKEGNLIISVDRDGAGLLEAGRTSRTRGD